MPVLTSNYPAARSGTPSLRPTPERVGALPEFTGAGVTIAMIDSGFYSHPDLRGRIRVHVDATTADIVESLSVPKSLAYSWHGMMTSVICAGDGWRSGGSSRRSRLNRNLGWGGQRRTRAGQDQQPQERGQRG